MAQDIARALGDAQRHGGYFESPDLVITSAIGHLVEIYNPDEETQDHKRIRKQPPRPAAGTGKRSLGKWSLDNLPALPAKFGLRPIKSTEERIKLIRKLAKRKEITGVVNACDAGREGELIFHYIARLLGFEHPVQRLWLQSMTTAAIRTAFTHLRHASEMTPLRHAAVARSEADWLVGINATRALTALNSKDGGFQLTTVGRVQTPTLAMLVQRERQRQEHVARKYWKLGVTFQVAAGTYAAHWVREERKAVDREDRPERIWEASEAQRLLGLLAGGNTPATGMASDTNKERRRSPPRLFDLNELQRQANRRHSLSARHTLRAAQSLYEKHKLITYPRTETRHLPPDYVAVCAQTLTRLANEVTDGTAELALLAAAGTEKAGKRVFDASKVSDHFALIPTGQPPNEGLPPIERKVYDLVYRRFLATFLPVAVVRETVRHTVLGGETFTTRGKVVLEPGWLAAEHPGNEDQLLPALAGATEEARVVSATGELEEQKTTPPARHDDSTLLGAMRGADEFVDTDDLSAALAAAGGLGTAATRASIIEELVRTEYVVRESKELIPTAKSFSLLELLTGMGISELTKPDLTGKWESFLRDIEAGTGDPGEFLDQIRELVTEVVTVAKGYDPDATGGNYAALATPCPQCGEGMEESYRKYLCRNCKFFFWKTVAGRQLTVTEAEQLLDGLAAVRPPAATPATEPATPAAGKDGKAGAEVVVGRGIGPFKDFKSMRGFPFTASIALRVDGKVEMKFPSQEADEVGDVDQLAVLGICPKCQGNVLEAPASYSCRHLLDGSGKCDFKLGKTICKRPLATEEAAQLVAPGLGRTALLDDFVSKRNRKFKAFLKLDATGRLEFEFEARAAKKKPAKKAAKTTGTTPRT